MNQRIVGLDFGLKRIGIAISDPLMTFSVPLIKINRTKKIDVDIDMILKSIENQGSIKMFVIGLPLLLNGKESPMSLLVREFAKKLEEISEKPVAFIDERLTSKQADTLLRETEMKRKKRDQVVDILSASLILQSFLDLNCCNK